MINQLDTICWLFTLPNMTKGNFQASKNDKAKAHKNYRPFLNMRTTVLFFPVRQSEGLMKVEDGRSVTNSLPIGHDERPTRISTEKTKCVPEIQNH